MVKLVVVPVWLDQVEVEVCGMQWWCGVAVGVWYDGDVV